MARRPHTTLAALALLASAGCVHHVTAPYPEPALLAVTRSSHTVHLESLVTQPDGEACVATIGGGDVCVRELRSQMERAVSEVLRAVATEAPGSEYVARLDQLSFRIAASRTGTELWLTWHFTLSDASGATIAAIGDSESAVSIDGSGVEMLFFQVEHDAITQIQEVVDQTFTHL